ncbi:MAG: hypothetical protein ACFE9S_07620 [Candidatus Hermodarchaeota archaeon]
MPEKVYYLDEVRDKYAQIRRKSLENKDEDIIYYMVSHLVRSGMPRENILPLLGEVSVLCDPLTITEDTKSKIDKSIEFCLNNRGDISLAQEVRDFVCLQGDYFLSTDIYRSLQLSTRKDKKNVYIILRRLIEEGLIEKCKDKKGYYRLIDKEVEVINWKQAEGKEFDIVLPLGLNKLVKIYPKNLIVIAGMSNSGKTAILLNIVRLNLDRHKDNIIYFTSEMPKDELKLRLEGFGLQHDVWDGCSFLGRSDFFHDVIDPNKINIIDYFEISNDFSDIAMSFRRIYNKLDKGIAIIALQKHPEKDEGSGGRFSREKPRLYLSLNEVGNWSEIKITKGKSWRDKKINPNGLIKYFEIEDGYQLIEKGNWSRNNAKQG